MRPSSVAVAAKQVATETPHVLGLAIVHGAELLVSFTLERGDFGLEGDRSHEGFPGLQVIALVGVR